MLIRFVTSNKGNQQLQYGGFTFYRHSQSRAKTRWACSTHYFKGCRARIFTHGTQAVSVKNEHNHPKPGLTRISPGELSRMFNNKYLLLCVPGPTPQFFMSPRGKVVLVVDGYKFRKNSSAGHKTRWRCATHERFHCKAVVHTFNDEIVYMANEHTTDTTIRNIEIGNYTFYPRDGGASAEKVRWRCAQHYRRRCRAYAHTFRDTVVKLHNLHTH
ncbi:hypothetical protein JYU34_004415 [Plutella xylostella]|uniref:FLYWCH-type domain-containing protein n=1 Tax=Plutella xylostella TaxID=51655 RepID=A0ABQ7QXX7_PLUXY|nr:hypothetical protein JYU34_004415 [Plutella xylostella]